MSHDTISDKGQLSEVSMNEDSMVKRPYTHEKYLASKESRKRATQKYLSKPENHAKHGQKIQAWIKHQYHNNPEFKERFKNYQRRSKDRRFLKSVDGDLLKFSEYLENKRPPRIKRGPEDSKTRNKRLYSTYKDYFSFSKFKQNLVRKTNLTALYGGRCVMCGDDNVFELQLHHINGDGGKERSELGWRGSIQNAMNHVDWRRYQLLCFDCHIETHRFLHGMKAK